MNMKKTAVKAVCGLALLAGASHADQIVIAGEVAPIATLVPVGGNTSINFNTLFVDVAVATMDKDDAVGVAKFFVSTNMPKWNIYVSFANGGRLLNSTGKALLSPHQGRSPRPSTTPPCCSIQRSRARTTMAWSSGTPLLHPSPMMKASF